RSRRAWRARAPLRQLSRLRKLPRRPRSLGLASGALQMAWIDKSLGEICQQIKDPQRNGGKSMAQLAEHMASDHLVAYGWNPPEHLAPVPGNQALFGELFQAWIDAGARCPAP